jgi:hypothetical protein
VLPGDATLDLRVRVTMGAAVVGAMVSAVVAARDSHIRTPTVAVSWSAHRPAGDLDFDMDRSLLIQIPQ